MEHCMTIQIVDKGRCKYCKIKNILPFESTILDGIDLIFSIYLDSNGTLGPIDRVCFRKLYIRIRFTIVNSL